MSRTLSIVGIAGTIIYLSLVWWIFDGRFDEIRGMQPNNIGDFLAGVLGPLSILWLILGFFQQGVELRQNTRALELQAEELRNSVEQQKSLVDVSRRQVEAELDVLRFERERHAKAALPNFVLNGVGPWVNGPIVNYVSPVKNCGNSVTCVEISLEPPLPVNMPTVPSWSKGEEKEIRWTYPEGKADRTAVITFSFIDASGLPGKQQFRLFAERDGTLIKVEPYTPELHNGTSVDEAGATVAANAERNCETASSL